MRRNALFAHGIEKYCSWCARMAVLRTDFIAGRSKFPDSSQLHRQSKRGAGSLQSIGNPYGKPRANPYRLKLQAPPKPPVFISRYRTTNRLIINLIYFPVLFLGASSAHKRLLYYLPRSMGWESDFVIRLYTRGLAFSYGVKLPIRK